MCVCVGVCMYECVGGGVYGCGYVQVCVGGWCVWVWVWVCVWVCVCMSVCE